MALNLAKQTAPAAGTNYAKLYTKTDGFLYWKDENGNEYAVPTSSVSTSTVNVFTAAQIGAPVALTSTAGSVAVDLALANNFSLLMTENTTVANPTNVVAGQGGNIKITQDATTAYTLAFAGDWRSLDGSAPSISTTLGAVNLLTYYNDGTYMWYSIATNGIA